MEMQISKFLNNDQIEKLKQSNDAKGKGITWSNNTIQRCIAIRSIVGRNGYEYLRTLKFPLPSYRTLCRRIQNSSFEPGIQYDVLQWLKIKMDKKPEYEKLCVLLVDEMQLKSRVELDKGLKRMVGYVSPETLPPGAPASAEKELATHALVYMLRGLSSSWKQTVSYLFTGNSLNKESYWEFTKKVIAASEEAGFKIQCVTSDMGPANTGLWNHVGIKSSKSTLTTAIQHPNVDDRKIYFVADPPHLLKNLWNCVLTHKITLDSETLKKHGLSSEIVSGTYVAQLMDLQRGNQLRLSYKLKECHYSPSQYEKMKVGLAAQFFSRSTAAAIQVAVRFNLLPKESLTTAWFLNLVNNWFNAMNSRHQSSALFYNEKTVERTEVLHEMLEVIKSLSFNGRKVWKPIQTGIQLSTTVVLQLSSDILSQYQLKYFLTGRLSQDPVENLFSQARGQGVMHPSCSIFRNALRLVTFAQYLRVSQGASYEQDDCSYLVDYLEAKCDGVSINEDELLPALLNASSDLEVLESLPEYDCTEMEPMLSAPEQLNDIDCLLEVDVIEPVQLLCEVTSGDCIDEDYRKSPTTSIPPVCCEKFVPLNELEENALYDVIGWAISRFISKVDCPACRDAFVSLEVSNELNGQYTSARSLGGLVHPTKGILSAAKLAESVFCSNKLSLHSLSSVELNITNQVLDVLDACMYNFPDCHNGLHRIMKKFVRLRINEHASTINRTNSLQKKQFGSKTACRNTIII